ncbi:MAG: YebC/PmpR family DNA-binding transcriptional regulator [Candidatus Babeliales bacterium]
MAGHSKWANIKHKKAAMDAKRGKAFTRITKEITVAARVGGGDLAANPRLRQLVDKARAVNMPMDNVNRAIKRGTGELPGVNYEAHLYEGYGPYGVAVIVEALTDNKNRTVADVRRLFSSSGGSLGEGGSVSWMFEKLGVVRTQKTDISEDQLLEKLLDFDVRDISRDEDTFVITCEPKSLEPIKQELESAGIVIENAELEWVANNPANLDDTQTEKAIAFLDELEEHDDVQNVYANLA